MKSSTNRSNIVNMILKTLERSRRRFIFAAVSFLVLGVFLSFPNQLTHECKPTLRLQLGVTEDTNYPYANGFCDEGYEPSLKYGLNDTYLKSSYFIFLMPFVVLPLVAMLIIFLNRKE